jgi:hypothetical protein
MDYGIYVNEGVQFDGAALVPLHFGRSFRRAPDQGQHLIASHTQSRGES